MTHIMECDGFGRSSDRGKSIDINRLDLVTIHLPNQEEMMFVTCGSFGANLKPLHYVTCPT